MDSMSHPVVIVDFMNRQLVLITADVPASPAAPRPARPVATRRPSRQQEVSRRAVEAAREALQEATRKAAAREAARREARTAALLAAATNPSLPGLAGRPPAA